MEAVALIRMIWVWRGRVVCGKGIELHVLKGFSSSLFENLVRWSKSSWKGWNGNATHSTHILTHSHVPNGCSSIRNSAIGTTKCHNLCAKARRICSEKTLLLPASLAPFAMVLPSAGTIEALVLLRHSSSAFLATILHLPSSFAAFATPI